MEQPPPPASALLFARFNSTQTRLCLGTKTGFLIFNLNPFKKLYQADIGGCSLVDNLGNTPLVYCVGAGLKRNSDPRLVQVFKMDHKDTQLLQRLSFETPVLGLFASHLRLFVVLEHAIHIYNTENLKFVTVISTSLNSKGLAAVSNYSERGPHMLVYPVSTPKSTNFGACIYDSHELTSIRTIEKLHQHPLQCFAFSHDSKLFACASQSGTVIKVHPVSERIPDVYSFRRGRLHSAEITSIAFSPNSLMLSVASNNGTLHLFKIREGLEKSPDQAPSSYSSMLSGLVWGEEARSFSKITLKPGSTSLSVFSADSQRIYVLTNDGLLGEWSIGVSQTTSWNLVGASTECTLIKEHNLFSDYLSEDEALK
eukprot:TRINITY_DN9032_c0_g1_i1.p1 TRINITY_DN9032_c0_g1~~TRINITY_DN9032_c0_g1_i1.p1  ORF type:complete len:369 (-),score=45.08 TRINITY_DN9032_c0_g1_i1:214-1320(-)